MHEGIPPTWAAAWVCGERCVVARQFRVLSVITGGPPGGSGGRRPNLRGSARVWVQASGAAAVSQASLLLLNRDGHGRSSGLGAPGGGVTKAAPVHHLVELRQVRLEVHVHGGSRQDGRGLQGAEGGAAGGGVRVVAGRRGQDGAGCAAQQGTYISQQ